MASPICSDNDGRARDGGQPATLTELLDRIEATAERRDTVSLGLVVDAVGRRSFGPILLLAGLIALSPLSGIPGMPTTVAVIVLLVAGQLLLKRPCCWLPRWLLRRSLSKKRMDTALRWLRRPARVLDRFLRPRLVALTHHAGVYLVAVLAMAIAAAMPPMELLPFAATGAGAALTILGLGLMAHDGVLTLIGLFVAVGLYGVVITRLFT